jgi:hypothetical protein
MCRRVGDRLADGISRESDLKIGHASYAQSPARATTPRAPLPTVGADIDQEALMRMLIILAATAFVLAGCGGDDAKSNTIELSGTEYAYVMPQKV